MSDLQVEGPALKKLIKIAKKNPLPFGFNPSTAIPECYLAMHRKKPAKMLGKDAKDEGSGGKSAFGTIKVEKKLMILQCERVVPNLAKVLKKYLKLQKVMLNIEVRDADGNVLEADVEDDLPDDPELDGDDEEEGIDKAALAKRLAELRKRIQGLDPKAVEKFSGPYAKVVGLFKKDELEACQKGAGQIEAALPKPGSGPKSDPALAKLVELYKKFSADAAKLDDATKRTNVEKALARAGAHLKARNVPEATALLAKIRDALAASSGATAETSGAQKVDKGPSKQVLAKSRILWVQTRKKMLSEVKRLEAEILKSEKADDANEPEDLSEIAAAIKAMERNLQPFDGRLEDALLLAVDAESADEKAKTLEACRVVLHDFQDHLKSDFFQSVDTENGYINVDVASTARNSIDAIVKWIG